MTSSNGNIFRVTGHLCEEFTGHRWIPRTKASNAELSCCCFYLRLNKLLSKQSWGWWFETLSRPLWHLCNVIHSFVRRVWSAVLNARWFQAGNNTHSSITYLSICYKPFGVDPTIALSIVHDRLKFLPQFKSKLIGTAGVRDMLNWRQ